MQISEPKSLPIQASTESTEIRHFHYVDALRGLAVMGVFLTHARSAVTGLPPWASEWFSFGMHGVQLFFVVSALTLCLSIEQRSDKDGKDSYRFFLLRRYFRIAPLYYVAILVYGAFRLITPIDSFPNEVSIRNALLSALFLHGFSRSAITDIPPGGWSIAVEMTFYVLLPFLFRWIRSLKGALLFFTATLAGSLTLKYFIRQALIAKGADYIAQEGWFYYFWFPNQLPVFALGIVAYHLLKREFTLSRAALWMGLTANAALFWFFAMVLGKNNPAEFLPMHVFFSICFVILTVLLARKQTAVLVNPFWAYLGKISFGVYLSHFIVLDVGKAAYASLQISTDGLLSSIGFLIITFAITCGLSHFAYQTIEQRGMAYGASLIRRRRAAQALESDLDTKTRQLG